MLVSLKRRRTSPDTYIAVNGSNSHDQTLANTPKRASYLSPTKASLSRSNPQLLHASASAKKSRESEPNRRQSLRDAVLGNKSVLPIADQQDVQEAENTANSEADPAVLTSFYQREATDPIASIEKEDEVPNTPRRRGLDEHSSSRRQRNNSTPRRNTQLNRFASPKIVPQLVDSPQHRRRSEDAELELPPTPVQLGKDKLPDRPRGLSSSSPGGSDRRRVRIRGGNIYSSPLKPREMAPVLSEDEGDAENDVEIASGLGDDDQDVTATTNSAVDAMDVSAAGSRLEEDMAASDTRPVQDANLAHHDHNSDMMEKDKKVKALQSQLGTLRNDLEQLQSLRARLNKSRASDPKVSEAELQLVLEDIDPSEPISTLPTDQNALFQKNTSAYLTLFAPTTLTMSYETWDKMVSGRQKFVYQTTFVASKPWPVDTFALTLDTYLDWDTDVVEDVVVVKDTKQHEMSKWMKSRLQDPVLRHDVATLVTAAGNFFEANINRARIWNALIDPIISNGHENSQDEQVVSESSTVSQNEAHSLLPYMFKNQHAFASSGGAQQRTRRSLGSAKQLMLTYDIDLDWLGRPQVKTEILMTGFGQETTEAAKKLYGELQGVEGVAKALNGVKSILGMTGNGGEENIDQDQGKMRAKKGKARRVTDFR